MNLYGSVKIVLIATLADRGRSFHVGVLASLYLFNYFCVLKLWIESIVSHIICPEISWLVDAIFKHLEIVCWIRWYWWTRKCYSRRYYFVHYYLWMYLGTHAMGYIYVYIPSPQKSKMHSDINYPDNTGWEWMNKYLWNKLFSLLP